MRNSIICVALSCIAIGTQAQTVNQCGFKIPPKSLKSSFQSVYEAKEVVDNMLDSIKWKENFQMKEQNGINNAYATLSGSKRWIVYDNDFLENMDSYAGTKWASYSVVAHEMGHHYYNHVIDRTGSTPPKEIEADYFSGYVMGRMGASLPQAVAAMEKLGSDKASATHPAKADRLASITKGWNYANTNRPTNQPTNPIETQPQPAPTPTPNPNTNPNTNTGTPTNDWIYLTHSNTKPLAVELSDDGRKYQSVDLKVGEPFVFKYDVYAYGWLRIKQLNGYKIYKLLHGNDYTLQWSRKQQSWILVIVQ